MIDINTALGMGESERPLQVGDWVDLIENLPCPRNRYERITNFPNAITQVLSDGTVRFQGMTTSAFQQSILRRVDPPKRDEVAELREQLAESEKWRKNYENAADHLADERNRLAEQLATVTRERDEAQRKYEAQCKGSMSDKQRIAHLETTVRNYQSAANKIAVELNEVTSDRDTLRDQLATVQAEAAAMRNIFKQSVDACQLVRRCDGGDWVILCPDDQKVVINTTMKELRKYASGTAGRELLDELKRKDERIADLERQIADNKRDAELCRELRALINSDYTDDQELFMTKTLERTLREIQHDGGAK